MPWYGVVVWVVTWNTVPTELNEQVIYKTVENFRSKDTSLGEPFGQNAAWAADFTNFDTLCAVFQVATQKIAWILVKTVPFEFFDHQPMAWGKQSKPKPNTNKAKQSGTLVVY